MTDQLKRDWKISRPEPLFWLDDHRGIYIPRDFADSFADRAKTVSGVIDEDWTVLEAGPDHELYWDTWDDVLQEATVTDERGTKFTLHQDGALWLIPEGMEWSDKDEFFVWPEDADDEVIEPEDQSQGDILGLYDERNEP